MMKLVNVTTARPIRSMKGVPIRSNVRSIMLDEEDIRTCILSKAKVEEILPNGTKIILNLANYNTANYAEEPKVVEPVQQKAPELKDEQPAQEEVATDDKTDEEPAVETSEPEVAEDAAVTIAEEVSTDATEVAEDTVAEEPAAEAAEEKPAKKTYGKRK